MKLKSLFTILLVLISSQAMAFTKLECKSDLKASNGMPVLLIQARISENGTFSDVLLTINAQTSRTLKLQALDKSFFNPQGTKTFELETVPTAEVPFFNLNANSGNHATFYSIFAGPSRPALGETYARFLCE